MGKKQIKEFLIFHRSSVVHLMADIPVNDGNASYTVRISTWWVPRLWTSWINFCDTIIRHGWRLGRPWSILTSVSNEIIHCWLISWPPCSSPPCFMSNPPLSTADPVVKDQSRMVGSSNVPALNTTVSTASLITGKNRKWGHAESYTLFLYSSLSHMDCHWIILSSHSSVFSILFFTIIYLFNVYIIKSLVYLPSWTGIAALPASTALGPLAGSPVLSAGNNLSAVVPATAGATQWCWGLDDLWPFDSACRGWWMGKGESFCLPRPLLFLTPPPFPLLIKLNKLLTCLTVYLNHMDYKVCVIEWF